MKKITTRCAICDTNNYTKILYKATFTPAAITSKTFSARRNPDRIHYQLLLCLRCGLTFSSPILSQKEISQLYSASSVTYDKESAYLNKTYGEVLETILPKTRRSTLRLLDIGCGNGFFLLEAMRRGVGHVYGVEPGKASVEKAAVKIKRNIRQTMLRKGLFQPNSFDIICCFHTLDHVIEPNVFLQIVYSLLKKNGKVLFVTHDTEGISVKLFGEKSPIYDIEHIYLFNKLTIQKIFRQNKFKHMVTNSLVNSYPLRYWLRLTPLPTLLKKYISDLCKVSHLERLEIALPAGNLYLTAEK